MRWRISLCVPLSFFFLRCSSHWWNLCLILCLMLPDVVCEIDELVMDYSVSYCLPWSESESNSVIKKIVTDPWYDYQNSWQTWNLFMAPCFSLRGVPSKIRIVDCGSSLCSYGCSGKISSNNAQWNVRFKKIRQIILSMLPRIWEQVVLLV